MTTTLINKRYISSINTSNKSKSWSKLFNPLIFGLGTTFGLLFYSSLELFAESISYNKKSEINVDYNTENTYKEAINESKTILEKLKDEFGIPGIIVGVSINGKSIWEEGFGYASLENRVPCTNLTVMRIASISKSITMALTARLYENKKLDLDVPIQNYVPKFPEKNFNDEKVLITTRHLVSHLSGIRHYDKTLPTEKKDKKDKDVEYDEFYSKLNYKSVEDSLSLFKDDPLHYKPGTKYLYTTHGFTLLSAVLEAAAEKPITAQFAKLFEDLGMTQTSLDLTEKLIYHRSSNYCKDKKGFIQNCPYVDNSCKWAGGGLLSTVGDLLKFGNAMLYSYQNEEGHLKVPGYIKDSTMNLLWKPVTPANQDKNIHYGMGWVVYPKEQKYGCGQKRDLFISHTGGAMGASSVLLIAPLNDYQDKVPPQGIVVTILVNLSSISLSNTAINIANTFKNYSITIDTK